MVTTVHFNELPLSTRERFVHAAKTPGAVLHVEHGLAPGCGTVVLLVASAVASVGVVGWLVEEGLGHAPIHHGEIYMLLVALLFVLFAIAIGRIARRIWPGAPYRTGSIYALASALVYADDEHLTIVPLADLDAPEITTELRNGRVMGHRLKLTPDFRLTMRFQTRPELDRVVSAIAAARSQGIPASDPFAECISTGTWRTPPTEDGPRISFVPHGVRLFRWLGAVGLAVVVSGALFAVMSAVTTGN